MFQMTPKARMLYIILFLLLVTGLMGCVSTKKRPVRLFREVVASGRQFDAIIVPGVPFVNGQWDTTMKGRVLWSCFLYQQGIARNIIYSGGAVYSPYAEAKIMGLYAQQLGIPEAHIFYDTLAEHSTENVYYAYLLAREQGFKSIALATDPFQSAMLKRFTRKRFATEIVHLPFIADTLKTLNHVRPLIDPSAAYVSPFRAITERESFWRRVGGTLGLRIKWEQKRPRGMAPL